jgi:hypothetical protein
MLIVKGTWAKLIVFLYFISMLAIGFNLIVTAAFVNAKMSDRAPYTEEYFGSSGDKLHLAVNIRF